MRPYEIILYGAYGYTGRLITTECKATGLNVLLAGRNAVRLQELSEATDYPYEACDLDDAASLKALLTKGRIVLHCAGPFQKTAQQVVNACLDSSTHYLDISGEFQVFEMLASYDARAKEKEILIMPGVGFDVVPSDCLALHLKNKLPGATHLQLAFTMSQGGMSRGTARTMIEGLGAGSMIRKDGNLIPIGLGDKVMEVDFGEFRRDALCIPWGDIATAWRSTGIPNIEVYSGVGSRTIQVARLGKWLNWLMRRQWVKDYLRKKVDAREPGPRKAHLHSGKSYLWGRARDNSGKMVEARMKTVNGYLLTARTAVLISKKLLSAQVRAGYSTPAQYFGEGLIFEVAGTSWI